MRISDRLSFAMSSLTAHKLRTGLTLLGMAVGIAAVVALTALAEGARLYVMNEFMDLGTYLAVVLPGKVETSGALPWGGVVRDLTLKDFELMDQRLEGKVRAAPIVLGTEAVRAGDRSRSMAVVGTTAEYLPIRRLVMASGRFLTSLEAEAGGAEMVLGTKAAREVFGIENPLGRTVRMGGWRFRVVGVLEPKGRMGGFDMDDIALIPVATAMKVFNRSSLFRILVEVRPDTPMPVMKRRLEGFFRDLHRAEDVTVISPDAMLASFSSIMRVLTLALAGIAGISLVVAGLGIMNIMLISVAERREEVGLLKALGGERRQVLEVFLTEAVFLSAAGGIAGLAAGLAAVRIFVRFYPSFPAAPPGWAVAASLALSLLVGSLAGILPAMRAAQLDPIRALARR
jgi:putative ABC transport system permease protein